MEKMAFLSCQYDRPLTTLTCYIWVQWHNPPGAIATHDLLFVLLVLIYFVYVIKVENVKLSVNCWPIHHVDLDDLGEYKTNLNGLLTWPRSKHSFTRIHWKCIVHTKRKKTVVNHQVGRLCIFRLVPVTWHHCDFV